MTTAPERSFVDANILVYAASPAMPQHQASRALLESAKPLCASPQVFAEFYSVVTSPRRVTAPLSPEEAGDFIAAVLPRMEMLAVDEPAVRRWVELAMKHHVSGADVFDLQLIATMLENGVRRIYTYNADDFTSFSELTVETPAIEKL